MTSGYHAGNLRRISERVLIPEDTFERLAGGSRASVMAGVPVEQPSAVDCPPRRQPSGDRPPARSLRRRRPPDDGRPQVEVLDGSHLLDTDGAAKLDPVGTADPRRRPDDAGATRGMRIAFREGGRAIFGGPRPSVVGKVLEGSAFPVRPEKIAISPAEPRPTRAIDREGEHPSAVGTAQGSTGRQGTPPLREWLDRPYGSTPNDPRGSSAACLGPRPKARVNLGRPKASRDHPLRLEPSTPIRPHPPRQERRTRPGGP